MAASGWVGRLGLSFVVGWLHYGVWGGGIFAGFPTWGSAVGVFGARFVWVAVPLAIWFVRVCDICVTF